MISVINRITCQNFITTIPFSNGIIKFFAMRIFISSSFAPIVRIIDLGLFTNPSSTPPNLTLQTSSPCKNVDYPPTPMIGGAII